MARVSCLLIAVLVTAAACGTLPWQKSAPPGVAELEPVSGGTAAGDTTASAPGEVIPPPGLVPSVEQRFPDVPVPAGVKPDVERTCVIETPTMHVGRMVYTSRASLNELAQFYINECPKSDWQRDSVVQVGRALISFTKPGKRLQVSIFDLGVARGRELEVLLIPDARVE